MYRGSALCYLITAKHIISVQQEAVLNPPSLCFGCTQSSNDALEAVMNNGILNEAPGPHLCGPRLQARSFKVLYMKGN